MKQITFKEYRNIDLAIWTVITVLFETITTFATAKWFYAQPVAISITLAIVCIVMMRWNGYAAIQASIGGLVFCIVSGIATGEHATAQQCLIYLIGNLFALISLLIIKAFGKEKIRESIWKTFLYVLAAYVGMASGRWLVSLFFGGDLMAFVVYATTDIISLLFAVIILVILRKTDGMTEDQKTYLLRLESEREEEPDYSETDHLI